MSAPSTTSYYPFDSEAPTVFRYSQTNNYLGVAFITLLLYDHAITLDKEVEWVWTLRWRLPKIVFFLNRYVICPLILLYSIPYFIFPASISFCNFYDNYLNYLPVLVFCVVQLLLVTRVCSLYGNRKFLIWSLRALVAGAVVGGAVAEALYVRQWYAILYYKFLAGCWVTSTYLNHITEWPIWAALLFVEGVLMLLTAYKLFSYRNEMNQTVAILARDSIVYFMVIFACLIMEIVSTVDINFTIQVMTPAQCIASIAVGRMMMNIRGLIMEDPEHTVHLQTLQFAARTNAGSEVEERTGGEA